MSVNTEKSFLQSILERRMLQFVVSYLVGAWGLTQFVEFLVTRYGFAPSWTDITIVFFLALLPSVILLTYFHGEPGTQRVRKIEKIILPTNVVVALGLVLFLFSGTPLGAVTSTVTVENEEGEKIERVVPKQAFTRRLALLPFENKSGEANLDWLSLTIPYILGTDLEQDNRLYSVASFSLKSTINKYDFELTDKLPFATKRKVADDAYSDFFFTGSIDKKASQYLMEVKVFSTKDGKEITQFSFENNNIFSIIDQVTESFINNLYLPDIGKQEGDTFMDLPATELFTSNLEALESYHNGILKARLGNQVTEGIADLQKTIELDPNCAECYLELSDALNRVNQTEAANHAMEQALTHSRALPERQQFFIRYSYYKQNNDLDKALSVLQMWEQLYPSNYKPYHAQMNIYQIRSDLEKAKAVGNRAMKAGHSGKMLLRLAEITSAQGHTVEAIDYYEQFIKTYPHRAQETTQLGAIFIEQGKFDKAQKHFEKILLLKPYDSNVLSRLAQVETAKLNFDVSYELYEKALQYAKTPQDSAMTYYWMHLYYQTIGQADKSIEALEKRWETASTFRTPFEISTEALSWATCKLYVNANRTPDIKARIDKFLKEFGTVNALFECVAPINYYIALEDAAETKAILKNCSGTIEKFQGANSLNMLKGFLKKSEGAYSEAIQFFSDFFNLVGLEGGQANPILGELYRLDGQSDKAIELLENSLKHFPMFAKIYYELALAYDAKGERNKALTNLKMATDIWKDADENYLPAQTAKALLKEWEQ